jgi:tripartite-type tricarboxylate transporter receptor subunit TctC
MHHRTLMLAAATIAILLLFSVGKGQADDFFKGRSLRIIVSYFPGGGNDLEVRLIARHMRRHLPGNPSVIVQNMPGAGTVIGANYLYRMAPQDGTVVGIFGPTQVVRQVIGVPGVEFQSENFNWLIAANVGDVVTCVAKEATGVRNLDDVIKRKEPLVVAASGPGSSTLTWPRAYQEILGANLKIVSGYPGAAGLRAAMERGEADATCISWAAYMRRAIKEMAASGTRVSVFTQMGMKAAPDLPQVQNALERVKSTTDRQVITALLTEHSMARPFVAPPGVPAERVQLLRKAFMDTLRDPRLLEEANKIHVEINPLPGEGVQGIVANLKNLPREVAAKVRSFME